MQIEPHRVGVLLYDGCFAAEAFGLTDLLTMANRVAQYRGDPAPFVTKMLAVQPGLVQTAGGTSVSAQRLTYALDLLVVPGFDFSPGRMVPPGLDRWAAEVAAIRRASALGLPTASICVGAFLLGEAGLLDGRRATTAWLATDELQTRHPGTAVDAKAVIVEDGPIITTGAFSATSDLALHLIRLHAGAETARTTSRITLTPAGRDSQAPFSDDDLTMRSKGAFSTAVRIHLRDRLDEPYDLPQLSSAFLVSTRTMLRRFRAETGETPLSYLQAARVRRAQRLLETTGLGVAQIATTIGYQDASTFRQLFNKQVGMGPSEYRRTFS